ncbi:group-specific protein [Bacillus pseudomycoides]|uniref:Group-specific protein n=1 Tax=Bacillus pseudomycoides TaxID=64104 RepID=A0A2A8C9F6_9BACI|nr:group-specific protein [Bacillus pseudomycoides]PDY45823.1 group-specific protein [Bacillus pseudomycoides]PEA80931.1 group-specific protein [Bacillus pseudomycoides]PED05547.1 group-specific protein [Bacillus pseudomycoides]PED71546.1 group-specific protein [Bacillus pseudomycoides]PEI47164.1 group-specific protein [Bacillus pseudomycoides]
MEYVYHMVPGELKGKYLMPLNDLKISYPSLYDDYIQKYKDHPQREKLLTRKIPKLECLWNDVLHFSSLHPHHIYQVINEIGVKININKLFYKIPISSMNSQSIAIYKYSKGNWAGPGKELKDCEIELINFNEYRELKQLNPSTIEYYRVEHENGRRFGIFHLIPHILFKGKVEVKDIEVINWSKPPIKE